MSTQARTKSDAAAGRTRDAGREMVRTRSGRLVPKGSLEAGVEAAAALEARWRKRVLLAAGLVGLLVLGVLVMAMARGSGKGSPIESILRDAGYVIGERKGIGIKR